MAETLAPLEQAAEPDHAEDELPEEEDARDEAEDVLRRLLEEVDGAIHQSQDGEHPEANGQEGAAARAAALGPLGQALRPHQPDQEDGHDQDKDGGYEPHQAEELQARVRGNRNDEDFGRHAESGDREEGVAKVEQPIVGALRRRRGCLALVGAGTLVFNFHDLAHDQVDVGW
eukprot:CAMPEP_0113825508 /NCGR_PEP_ID=MMETSP0328-20130328/3784_1 /TAXON_ID=39455 /ORGANISM="Alexandrium minutum" /LENGTH=172 /DNA_ID=CAMNT_0000793461 /DNA_START=182 /DNA_END=697 /DNA_ORIENTATION=+ /assembly_acc=CAM_ASM_000350